jgi:hypothetical protein
MDWTDGVVCLTYLLFWGVLIRGARKAIKSLYASK